MVKIAIIGAGSTVFMKNIVTDIVLEPGLETAHIALHDIDEARLATSEKVAHRITQSTHTTPTITATLNRRAALAEVVEAWRMPCVQSIERKATAQHRDQFRVAMVEAIKSVGRPPLQSGGLARPAAAVASAGVRARGSRHAAFVFGGRSHPPAAAVFLRGVVDRRLG